MHWSSTAPDARRIVIARGLRQFAYGQLAVVLAIALSREGFDTVAIGALVTVSLLGDFCATALVGRYADRGGRRRTLSVLALCMALTGLVFGITGWYPLLLVAAFFGTLGTSASETAPFLSLEQAILAQVLPADEHTAIFARYNLVASLAGALGGLAAALPDVLVRLGVARGASISASFVLYAVLALAVLALVRRLSSAIEVRPGITSREHTMSAGMNRQPVVPRSRRAPQIIVALAALFSVDAFAGGLIAQTLLALFFHLRFGVPLAALGVLFFSANLLSALSFLAAVPLARRFGLLYTMVFTHLPSNVLLVLVAFMPTFPLAALLLLLRNLLSQMDVPTRQAYTMALVAPEQRTAAASITSLARSAGSATSPVLAGALLQGPWLLAGAPLLIAGSIKAVYDLVLWRVFRRVPLETRPQVQPLPQRADKHS